MRSVVRYQSQLLFRKSYKPARFPRIKPVKLHVEFRPVRFGVKPQIKTHERESDKEEPMNSGEPGSTNEDDHSSDTTLNRCAAKLNVYRRERLAYTEVPVKQSAAARRSARTLALLKAMYYWVLSRM